MASVTPGPARSRRCERRLTTVPAEVPVRRVLLLNVTYEPLTTVGLRRAVCLVLGEKAEIVHHDTGGKLLHAATVEVVTPSVIRLRRYVRIPQRNRVPLTRAALMRRDNYKCAYCGRHGETIDHVLPRQPRRSAHLGELRRRLPDVQPPQGRPPAIRARLDPPRCPRRAERSPLAPHRRPVRRRPPVGGLPAARTAA